MKKQLLVMLAIMVATCVNAQVWQKSVREVAPFTKSQAIKSNRATIEPQEGQFWWGYMTEADLSNPNSIGTGSAGTYMGAIFIPANHAQIGGGTIKAVRIYVADGLASAMSNASIWISKSAPASAAAADYSQPVKSLADGANDIALNTPYAINNEAFYVGYSVNSTNGYPIMSCGTQDAPNTFLIGVGGEWDDLNGYGFGKLAFQILIDGVTLPDYSATAADPGTSYTIMGKDTTLPISIQNNGKENITSISYTVETNGNTSSEMTAIADGITFNNTGNVSIVIPADNEAVKTTKIVTITKVNGQPNAATNKSVSFNVVCLTSNPEVTPVIEEFTGTWCGWCPVGFAGLKYVHETYGDKVVLIAAHYDDPMAVSDYNPIINGVSGFPGSYINRMLDVYPHPQNFAYYLPAIMQMTVPGSINVTAEWATDEQKAININTNTTFRYTDNSAQYSIAFVLVEDGLTGTGSKWKQNNNLSHNNDYKDLTDWYNAPSVVSDMVYDHVAVGAWSILTGVANSVPTSFTADEVLPFAFNADISTKSVIQDKTKLTVVALLIDKSNSSIINAAQCNITDATAIKAIESTNATEAARYTLDGRQIAAPQRGLNIVRMSDGTTRKVIVK